MAAGSERLPPPSATLHRRSLPTVNVAIPRFRSHPVDLPPIHYGRNAEYRFDDPRREYGVLYLAEDAFGAFIETFGQFVTTVHFPRPITSRELSSKALSEVICDRPLKLVDLRGSNLPRIGADARLFAGDRSDAQLWSRALHDHPEKADGLIYPTRHDPSRNAAAIFSENLLWDNTSRRSWLSLGITLRDILNKYDFALIETHLVPQTVRKPPQQETLFPA